MKHSLFALILTTVVSTGTLFAQNQSDVIAAGQPPLTREMVNNIRDLFEAVLGGQMTPQERAEFEKQRIAEWERNDSQSISTAQTMIQVREKALALSAEKRAEFIAQFRPLLIENLQKTPDDSTSKLLLGVYSRSQISSNLNTSAVSSQPISGPLVGGSNGTNNFNSAIVGEWAQGYTSTIGFTNTAGGTNSAGTNQVGMRFERDGTYKSAYYVQSSMYGCTVTAFGYKTGNYHVIGSTVYLDEKTYSLSSKDSCNSSRNSEKNPPLTHVKYNFSVRRDAEGEKLYLQTKSGDDIFYKNTGKSMLDH